jgi:hypothetical protein
MAVDAKVTIDATAVVRNLERISGDVKSKLGAALYGVAQKVRLDSMKRTPVDTGALKSSHTVSSPKLTSDGVEVTIGVGGASADYAVYVHEDLSKRHPNGEAKFLERAVLEESSTFGHDLAKMLEVLIR